MKRCCADGIEPAIWHEAIAMPEFLPHVVCAVLIGLDGHGPADGTYDWGNHRDFYGLLRIAAGEKDLKPVAQLLSSFRDEALHEAKQFPDALGREDLDGREDFRDLVTFTIDPFDAKDHSELSPMNLMRHFRRSSSERPTCLDRVCPPRRSSRDRSRPVRSAAGDPARRACLRAKRRKWTVIGTSPRAG